MSIVASMLMPLRLTPLTSIVVLSIALTLSVKTAPFGLPLALILLSWIFIYTYVYLDLLVNGETELPVLSMEMIVSSVGQWRTLVPFLIFVMAMFFASGSASYLLGWIVATLVSIPLLIVLPAVLAVQSWTGSNTQSLNPVALRDMASILGDDYKKIVICALVLALVCGIAQSLSDAVPMVVRIALFLYAWLATVTVIGRSLFAKRPLLEATTLFIRKEETGNAAEELRHAREAWIDSIYGEWRGGSNRNAWQTVQRRLQSCDDPIAELRWLYARVVTWGDIELANQVTRDLLPRLLALDMSGQAIIVARERLAVDEHFRPVSGADAVKLAQLASAAADRDTARRLLHRFADHYPGDALQSSADSLVRTLQ